MPFDRKRSLGYLTNHLARLFAHRLQTEIAPLGLAPAQFMAMLELWEEDGVTQADLGTRLDVEQATMANTLKRMERDGLIERRPHPEDRRAQLIHLTDKGRSLEKDAKAAAEAVNRRAAGGLSATDAAEAIRLLTEMIDRLKR